MKINGLALLHEHVKQYPKTKSWIENWIADVRAANWTTPHDIKARYARASILPSNIVIFDVCGNQFRLETIVAYRNQLIVVRWIGTHADYSRRRQI